MPQGTSPSETEQAARRTMLAILCPEQDLPSDIPASPSRLRSWRCPCHTTTADVSGAGQGCRSRISHGTEPAQPWGLCPSLRPAAQAASMAEQAMCRLHDPNTKLRFGMRSPGMEQINSNKILSHGRQHWLVQRTVCVHYLRYTH